MQVSERPVVAVEGVRAQDAATLSWDDVFVKRRMPFLPFAQSAVMHGFALALLLAASRLNWVEHEIAPQRDPAQETVHYVPTPYLPPLDTRTGPSPQRQPADPAYSPQAIISLPPDPDNDSQTVVTPAQVKMPRQMAMPNVLNWPEKARMPVEPAPVLAAEIEHLDRNSPRLENSVVAPPPDVSSNARQLQSPQESVIAPPPTTVESRTRNFGDISIAHSEVIAPAPQLAVSERRSFSGTHGSSTTAVVAPPPSVPGGPRSGKILALNLQPAVGAPPAAAGNRRGSFAATPQGKTGASGTPPTNSAKSGNGSGGNAAKSGLPSGLYVGKPAAAPSAVATATPRVAKAADVPAAAPDGSPKLTGAERQVFGDRRVYSLTLNMPNLNSAGGSWIVRFAERNAPPSPRPGSGESAVPAPALSAPLAVHKVDPAYPIELMRENVAGTVVLYAVIQADGSVGQVRVLDSVDERLDLYASQALARWEFRPATKDGSPVDVEATFRIPFRPSKRAGF